MPTLPTVGPSRFLPDSWLPAWEVLMPAEPMEERFDDVVGRWMFARHRRVSSYTGSGSLLELLSSAGLAVVAREDADLQLAKSECYAIATAGIEDEEIVDDFQDMAANAHRALTRFCRRLSGADTT